MPELIPINLDPVSYTSKPSDADFFGAGGIKYRLANNPAEVTGDELQTAICSGRTFTAGQLTGTKAETWKRQRLLAADIDNDMKLPDGSKAALPLDQQLTPEAAVDLMAAKGLEPFIIYKSFHYAEDWKRFRVLALLDEEIEDPALMAELIRKFIALFPGYDSNCTNLDRVYFGSSPDCIIMSCTGKTTPASAVMALPDPKAKPAPQPARPALSPGRTFDSSHGGGKFDLVPLLDFIPVADLSREQWRNVGMALKAEGYDWTVWDSWSMSDSRYKPGECQRQWNSFTGTGITGATITHLAKLGGWESRWKDRDAWLENRHNQSGYDFDDSITLSTEGHAMAWDDEIDFSTGAPAPAAEDPAEDPARDLANHEAAEDPATPPEPADRPFYHLDPDVQKKAVELFHELKADTAYRNDALTDISIEESIRTILRHSSERDPAVLEGVVMLPASFDALAETLTSTPVQNKISKKKRGKTLLQIKIMEALEAAPAAVKTISWTSAAELKEKEIAPVRFVVKDLLPEGLVLLAAPPKTGKSFLCLDIGESVVNGAPVLGHDTEKCEVCYLALEDSDGRLKRRLDSMGSSWPKDLHIAFEAENMDTGFMDQLEATMKAFPGTGLLIVDTLAKVRGELKRNESAYQYDSRELGILQKFALQHHICLMLITHTRKMLDDSDSMNQISGSTGLTGIADAMLMICKAKRADNTATLVVTGRDLEYSETAIMFDSDLLRWQYLGTAEAYKEYTDRKRYLQHPLIRTIKRRLEDGNGTYTATPEELQRDAVYITKAKAASSTQELNKLLKDYLVRLNADGILVEIAAQNRRYTFTTQEALERETEVPDWVAAAGDHLEQLDFTETI